MVEPKIVLAKIILKKNKELERYRKLNDEYELLLLLHVVLTEKELKEFKKEFESEGDK